MIYKIPEFETIELIAMIFAIIAMINFPFIAKKRPDFMKFLPGLYIFTISFVIDALDDLVYYSIFELIGLTFFLIGAILIVVALLFEIKELKTSPVENKTKRV